MMDVAAEVAKAKRLANRLIEQANQFNISGLASAEFAPDPGLYSEAAQCLRRLANDAAVVHGPSAKTPISAFDLWAFCHRNRVMIECVDPSRRLVCGRYIKADGTVLGREYGHEYPLRDSIGETVDQVLVALVTADAARCQPSSLDRYRAAQADILELQAKQLRRDLKGGGG